MTCRSASFLNSGLPEFSLYDQLYAQTIGPGEEGIEQLYRRMYVRLANYYRASDSVQISDTNLYAAAAAVLRTDADFAAAIALTFRISLVNIFYPGDLYAGTGVVTDPRHPPQPGDATEQVFQTLLGKTFENYIDEVFVPYFTAHRPGATRESLIAANRLDIVADRPSRTTRTCLHRPTPMT